MAKRTLIFLCALTGLIVSASSATAERLYVPTVHILTTNGEYNKLVLAGTEGGVGRQECLLRLEAWEDQYGSGFAAAQAQVEAEGGQAGLRTSCEPKG